MQPYIKQIDYASWVDLLKTLSHLKMQLNEFSLLLISSLTCYNITHLY
jgi:hypothetical protein